jgi:Protein of unknown function (DUF3147)
MSIWIVPLKGVLGGIAVVALSLVGEASRPKRFAGLFAAAPSVALASLLITVPVAGSAGTVPYARGMLIGSAGMVAYCLASLVLIDRLHALLGSILSWLAWLAVAGGLYLLAGR